MGRALLTQDLVNAALPPAACGAQTRCNLCPASKEGWMEVVVRSTESGAADAAMAAVEALHKVRAESGVIIAWEPA